MDALLLMGRTLFVLIVLGGGALVFSADANRLVLIPIDRMVQRVKTMADNPRDRPPQLTEMPLEASDTEMRILEASIDKISELLGVAFGDAGVDIISSNMSNMGGLNPMVPGQKTVRKLVQAPNSPSASTADVWRSRGFTFWHCEPCTCCSCYSSVETLDDPSRHVDAAAWCIARAVHFWVCSPVTFQSLLRIAQR